LKYKQLKGLSIKTLHEEFSQTFRVASACVSAIFGSSASSCA
jgi:hypothetical protein